MTDLPLAAVKRLASVKGKGYRVGEDAVEIINRAASAWIKHLAEEAFVFTIHSGRTTLKSIDVIPVLEKMGMKVPSVPTPPRPKPTPAKTAAKAAAKKK